MTDAHFHRSGDTFACVNGREFRFVGIHPWNADGVDIPALAARLRAELSVDTSLGVGEIGLDRLKDKTISSAQRDVFAVQLDIAAEMERPVVLHGAKCWGEVVKAVRPYAGGIPAFMFHGFSRSDGLLPDIVAMNGFIGVGKAVLNDHAVNYRQLVKKLPCDRLLLETDVDGASEAERISLLRDILAKTAEIASVEEDAIDSNAGAFLKALA